MNIDEAIIHAEEVAEEQEQLFHRCLPEYNCDGLNYCFALENGKNRGCLKCAAEHRQLAAWLKELKAYREAFEKAKRTVKAYLMLEEFGSEYQDDIEKLIEECRPKEGDSE